jgi:hypothetical protein
MPLLELLLIRRLAGTLHLQVLELDLFGRRLDHDFLHGDLGRAIAAHHRLAGLLRLDEFRLGRANGDVGLGIIRQHGDDLVALDLLAIRNPQFDKHAAARRVAGNQGRACRRVSVATGDQRRQRTGPVLRTAGLPAGSHPQDEGRANEQHGQSSGTPSELSYLGHYK